MIVSVSPLIMKWYRDTLQVPVAPGFLDTDSPILPVRNITPVQTPKQLCYSTGNLAAGTNTFTFTVPIGRKWIITNVHIWNSGVALIKQVKIREATGSNDTVIADGTGAYVLNGNCAIVLQGGQRVLFGYNGAAGTESYENSAWGYEEDAY